MTPSSTRAVPAEAARRNAATVVRTVLAHGPLPRLRIAELTGISAGTVSRLTARLAAAGQLVELPAVPGPTETGRPRVPLDLPLATTAVAGVHIGLLRTTLGLVDLRGEVLAQLVLPRGSTEPDHVVAELTDAISTLTTAQPTRRLLGVGVSTGGWVDTEAGTVVEHGPLGWRDVPLQAQLAARLDPPVRLDGLVRALALAEGWYGAGQRADSLLELFVGNVVGAAFTVARQIHHGPRSAAGGITHLRLSGLRGAPCDCGHHDCLQATLTDHSVLRLAVQQGLLSPDDPYEELVRRAQNGEPGAVLLLRTRARWIGRAVATLLDLVNPELVVLAGGPLLTPEYLPDTRAELVRHSALGPAAAARLVPSGLGEHSLVLSAAAVFLDAWFSDPLAHSGGGGSR
ncbi:ROK family protein [Kitasatospora sp. P5_F3]